MNMQPIARPQPSKIVGLWQQRVPLSPDVLSGMSTARAYLQQGQAHEAKAVADALHPLAPLEPRLLHLRADCTLAAGDYLNAITLFERALTQSDLATLWGGKGTALRALKRYRQAAACFQRAAALDLETSEYRCDAAECLQNAGQPQDAFDVLEFADLNSRVHLLRALVLRELGKGKSAFENACVSAQIEPKGTALRLARRLAVTDQDRDAVRTLCAPLVSKPDVSAKVVAASIPPEQPLLTKSVLSDILANALRETTPTQQKATLNHILFRHYDAADDRNAAQKYLTQFHKSARETVSYRRSHDSALFTILKRLRFTALPRSKTSILPIFVTGLPGAGRAYASDLLQSAAQPTSARPLQMVNAVMTRFIRQLRQTGARDVSRDDLMTLQSELRAGLFQAASDSEVVIDTAMLNFRWSGLISAALPEARIVHVKRDQMQTGWAMYSGAFDTQDLGCRHDLCDLRAFQEKSGRLMDHWENQFGGSVIAVCGDALRRKSGQTARALVDACHLKWSEKYVPAVQAAQSDWYRYADLLTPLRNTQNSKDGNTSM
ncbi:MAG: tetratricopeptide (TPR) repeat protein [Ascidiaceihabitans sp.]|jgi:tetratricopeptide (TPR) repeat protein